MSSPVTWLRNFIDRLLRLDLFLPLVAVGAVVVVILAPVLWSFYEISFYFGSRDSTPAAHVYEVNRGTEKYLEQAFALDNGIQGFSPVERDLMLKFTIALTTLKIRCCDERPNPFSTSQSLNFPAS